MNQTIQWKKTQPGSTEAVKFSDGMLVTAEDLTASMQYPLAVVQVLLRSYFGCGVVCGLELADPAGDEDAGTYQVTDAAGQTIECPPGKRGFVLRIERGVALGCDGYPIELCGPVKLDLTPDPCRLDPPTKLYIAIRRVTAVAAAPHSCGCGTGGQDPEHQCTRQRDHALIQAFEKLPDGICARVDAPNGEGAAQAGAPGVVQGVCECMKQCPDCDCCAEPWVLLGSVGLDAEGLVRDGVTQDGRRYVKPVACICDAPDAGGGRDTAEAIDRLQGECAQLRNRLEALEPKAAPAPQPEPPPPDEPAAGK